MADHKPKVKVGSSFGRDLDILFVKYLQCFSRVNTWSTTIYWRYVICFFIDITSDIANYENETCPYKCAPYYHKLKECLELAICKMFNWFKYNNLKANATKCHFFLLPYQSVTINIDDSIIKSSHSQKLLRVTIDSNFTFE